MKKSPRTSLTILSLSFTVVTSCSKDVTTPTNEFVLNGVRYEISSGVVQDFGSNGNGTFDFDVTLYSSGVIYTPGSGSTGTGEAIYINFNTPSATGLKAGNYIWSATREDFTIVDGIVAIDYNFERTSG